MADRLKRMCHFCGNVGFNDGLDGFFYCSNCGSQAEDMIDTAVAEEDLIDQGDGALYSTMHTRRNTAGAAAAAAAAAVKLENLSQSQPPSQFFDSFKALHDDLPDRVKVDYDAGDGMGPSGPTDFAPVMKKLTAEDYASEVRMRYVMGMQIMIQLQCKALVEKFKVNPVICGMAGTIWLKFVASTGVFEDNWAADAIHLSESLSESQKKNKGVQDDGNSLSQRMNGELYNIHGERAVMIWYRSLVKAIPISYSMSITYLVCHIAREAVLPTDLLKWSLEGTVPFLAAYLEIEKQIGPSSRACPLSCNLMFRPYQVVPLYKLESVTAIIAQIIGLELPPVNFYLIAARYLRQLSLPVEKILPHACRIYEWSMPPELWISTNELRLPTRAFVISILIVAIRIIYKINGFGNWEMSLSTFSGSTSSRGMDDSDEDPWPDLDAGELLYNLEAKYDVLLDSYAYAKDLPSYLLYCEDVAFAGLQPSLEDHDEAKIIDELRDFYHSQKDFKPSDKQAVPNTTCLRRKRLRDDLKVKSEKNKKIRDDRSSDRIDGSVFPCKDSSSHIDRAIRRLKSNMEDNRFSYIPPRTRDGKKSDYLLYPRKRDCGSFTYTAHADYYILLRSFATLALVEMRPLHAGVLSFERRLVWLEDRIEHSLHMRRPTDSCEFCHY